MTTAPYTLFISDLHLQESQPEILQLFYRFLQQQAPHADALYILGDLFEVWLGDDDNQVFLQTVKNALKTLVESGVPVYIMAGNRDFLLGQRFAQESGCKMLQDPTLIDLYGQSVLLTHGDFLCTQDRRHQYFRRFVQQSWIRRLILAIPLKLRRKMGKRLRHMSYRRTQQLADNIMDVTPEAVQQLMARYQTARLIHGHTHLPAIHNWLVADQNFSRMVLGAWHEQGSALIYDAKGHAQLEIVT
ncbi:MAG: UDP-2,3-diacylglucosamine diphosphatase [Gammaproteobacteria bacterium]